MRMLSLVVKHMLYLPAQVIIKHGDIGHYMYFITKGEVEVINGLAEREERTLASSPDFPQLFVARSRKKSGSRR